MDEQKEPLKYTNGTYIGKEFKKKFVNDDGTVTKSFKMQFLVGNKTWNFWSYDKTKGFENLEEGEDYSIGYIEKDNPQGEMPIKVARYYGEPRQSQQQNNDQKQETTKPQSYKDKYGLEREDSIEIGQAINLTMTKVTSHPQYQGEINPDEFEENLFNTVLPLIARCKNSYKDRKYKMEQAIEKLDEEMREVKEGE